MLLFSIMVIYFLICSLKNKYFAFYLPISRQYFTHTIMKFICSCWEISRQSVTKNVKINIVNDCQSVSISTTWTNSLILVAVLISLSLVVMKTGAIFFIQVISSVTLRQTYFSFSSGARGNNETVIIFLLRLKIQ